MNLWILKQIKYRDPELYAHTIIVRARTETKAREIAQNNEDNHRDGELSWGLDCASCDILTTDGPEELILCA